MLGLPEESLGNIPFYELLTPDSPKPLLPYLRTNNGSRAAAEVLAALRCSARGTTDTESFNQPLSLSEGAEIES